MAAPLEPGPAQCCGQCRRYRRRPPQRPLRSQWFASRAGLILVPLADWNHEKQIGAVGKMRDVRHPRGPVMTQCLQLLLILMGAYDHDVRTHVKLAAR